MNNFIYGRNIHSLLSVRVPLGVDLLETPAATSFFALISDLLIHLSFALHLTPLSIPTFLSSHLFLNLCTQEAVATIIYCAQRVEPIGEFVEVANLLSVKFGAEWAKVKKREICPFLFFVSRS